MPTARKSEASARQDPLLFLLLSKVGIVAQLSQSSRTRLVAPELNLSQFIVLNHLVQAADEISFSWPARAARRRPGYRTAAAARGGGVGCDRHC
jgi:hypothetical protein